MSEQVKKLDLFSSEFYFGIDNGNKKLKTMSGTIFTFILGIILIAFAVHKTNVLLSRSSVNVVTSVKDNFIKVDERFGTAQGFAVAAAWSANGASSYDLQPSIG